METVPLASDLSHDYTRLTRHRHVELPRVSEGERWALVAYIRTLSPSYSNQTEPETVPKKLENSEDLRMTGKTLFNTVCLNCHGSEGQGPLVPMNDHNSGKAISRNRIDAQRRNKCRSTGVSMKIPARTLLTGFHRRSPMLSWKQYLPPAPRSIGGATQAIENCGDSCFTAVT